MPYRTSALALTVSRLTVRDAGRSILPPMHVGLIAFSRFRLREWFGELRRIGWLPLVRCDAQCYDKKSFRAKKC